MQHARGFTLIELMVVVAIIAILAAIAIPAYSNYIDKTQFSEALTISGGLKPDIGVYFHQTGECPTNGADGLDPAASYAGKYVASATVASITNGCSITAQFRSATVAPKLRGKQVVLSMIDSGGTTDWKCTSDAPPEVVPQACR